MSRDYALEPIARREWRATEQDGTDDRALPVREFWLHHSVTIAPDLLPPFDDDDAAVRTLERIGEQRFGAGISYTHPVTPVGRLYVGHSLHRVGSHTRGHNTIGAAFVLVGDYSSRKPSAAAVEVIARRMVALHRQGKATRHTLNGGHTQASVPEGGTANTACPGAAGLDAVPVINRRAEQLWAAGYPTTPATESEFVMATRAELIAALTSDEVTDVLRHRIIAGAVCRNPLDPASDQRVSLSNVAELTAGQAIRNAAELGALRGIVDKLAAGEQLTVEQVRAAAEAGAQAALDERIAGAQVVLEVTAEQVTP